ncbi:hypothetical protein [Hyalangium rubrum]|uniref:Uncharacterized protein n=1 Tax=Hyalangium rubrum TaxID=3103134 RepID=A0ABU5GZ04_9BACT|nr:hypothetical protein [Hyalangium sp. s54d21]MDY7226414.1 hypothetical protein [Hyalangium sp. s54d21]
MLKAMGTTTDGANASNGLFSREMAPEPRKPWLGRAAVVGAIAAVGLGIWMWMQGSEGGALRAMSPVQREALFKETWKDYRMRCTGGAEQKDTPAVCHQRAEFLQRFPQCDEACRAQIAPSLSAAPQ